MKQSLMIFFTKEENTAVLPDAPVTKETHTHTEVRCSARLLVVRLKIRGNVGRE